MLSRIFIVSRKGWNFKMMVKQRRFREDRDTEFLLLLEWFKLCLTSWRSQCFKKSAWLFEFPLRERPRVSNKLRGTISGLNWRMPPDLTRAADDSLRKPLKVNGTDCRDFMLHRCLRKILSHLMKRSESGLEKESYVDEPICAIDMI